MMQLRSTYWLALILTLACAETPKTGKIAPPPSLGAPAPFEPEEIPAYDRGVVTEQGYDASSIGEPDRYFEDAGLELDSELDTAIVENDSALDEDMEPIEVDAAPGPWTPPATPGPANCVHPDDRLNACDWFAICFASQRCASASDEASQQRFRSVCIQRFEPIEVRLTCGGVDCAQLARVSPYCHSF